MIIDIEQIRKLAAIEAGRLVIDERFSQPKLSAVDTILLQKMANVDMDLMKVAMSLRPDCPVTMYEDLGGAY